ncbi:MAG: Fis family transcriptional regulator [Gemmatimonadetes bacterium]|nr:Fis family transcriptional regulator [Gemmatimonadota bacterium]
MSTVLIIDDDAAIRQAVSTILGYDAHRIVEAEDGIRGLQAFDIEKPDVVLLDVKMPGLDGLEVLRMIREDRGASTPVIMFTGHGDFQTAAEAGRWGIFDFIEKPGEAEVIRNRIRNALRQVSLERENSTLREQFSIDGDLIGDSPAMRAVKQTIERVAKTQARVLICGESGTGKELVARAIHRSSPRSAAPLIKVNCAAIPDELIESELFGHEKGSFTGAHAKKIGKFEAADGGTLFLDEIGDMPLAAQAKVLRVLQEDEVERVGGNKTIRVDVRVVAATNKALGEEISEGRFREDLFYRLNVVPIDLPPLRERGDDIDQIALSMLSETCQKNGLASKVFTPDALAALRKRSWQGNVRELHNLVERVAILSPGDEIGAVDLPSQANRSLAGGLRDLIAATPTLSEFKDLAERAYLESKLAEHGWNIAQTAKAIEVQRSNIYKKMERHGLTNPNRAANEI